ncbi:MAG: DUF1552 domain-containing protein [Pseudomonadota bacterium]
MKVLKEKYSRRAILKALGVGGAMLPLLNNEAFAATAPAGTLGKNGFPTRFIAIACTNGLYQPAWWQSGNDLTTGTLLPILSPLTPFRSKMLIPHNICNQDLFDGSGSGLGPYAGHFAYEGTLSGTAQGKSPSIDTLIAKATPDLPNAQLNLGCHTSDHYFAIGQNGPIKANKDPSSVFAQLFAGANLTPAQMVNIQGRKKSILDLVSSQLTAFQGVVGTDDKAKIQSHLDAVRNIESSLSTMTAQTVGCAPPTMGAASSYGQSVANYPALVAIQLKLAAAAVTCGLSRAITIELNDDGGANFLTFPWLKVSQDNYHAIAHRTSAGNPNADKTLIDQWFHQQYATNLLAPLDSTAEGSGTALDNTCVLITTDMQDGQSHWVKALPWTIVGSCGGFFKTGRVVECNNAPNNKLLTSIMHAMGQTSVTSVGNTKYAGDLDSLLT